MARTNTPTNTTTAASTSERSPVTVVLTSEATPERAEALAHALLEQRLVACVSLLPVRSHYHWQGKIESGDEVKLLLKTTPEQLPALHRALHALHGYQTPEWIELSGSSCGDYGHWLVEQLNPANEPEEPQPR